MKQKEGKLTDSLPEEIWLTIFKIGIKTCILYLEDLCSISLTSKLFSKLWHEDSIWSLLLTLDSRRLFLHDKTSPPKRYSSSTQTIYKYRLGRLIKSKFNEMGQRIEKNEQRMSQYSHWVQLIRDKLAQKSHRDCVRIRRRIGMTDERLEKLSELFATGMDKGEKVIALCTRVSLALDAPSVKAQSSSASAQCSSSDGPRKKMVCRVRALGGLRKKIDKLLAVHRDKISSYAWQKDVACTLVRTQLENFEQLILFTSRLSLLSSGSNPIKTGGVSGDCDYYEDDDYDSDDSHNYDFDYCGDITDNDIGDDDDGDSVNSSANSHDSFDSDDEEYW